MKYFFFIFLLITSCTGERSYSKVSTLDNLQLGDTICSFSAISESGLAFSTERLKADAYIFYINNELSPICLNEECEFEIETIESLNVDFIGVSDGKLIHSIGLDNQSVQANPVLICADQDFTVTSIYQKVALDELEEIVQLEKERLSSSKR